MGYNTNDGIVRVDRFKPSGKWYDSLAIDMSGYYNLPCITDALIFALKHAGHSLAYSKEENLSWMYVCLEPYHMHSHPIVLGKC